MEDIPAPKKWSPSSPASALTCSRAPRQHCGCCYKPLACPRTSSKSARERGHDGRRPLGRGKLPYSRLFEYRVRQEGHRTCANPTLLAASHWLGRGRYCLMRRRRPDPVSHNRVPRRIFAVLARTSGWGLPHMRPPGGPTTALDLGWPARLHPGGGRVFRGSHSARGRNVTCDRADPDSVHTLE